MSIGHEPVDDNGREIVGWDATNHRPAVPQITGTTQDASGVVYGTVATSGGGGGGGAITAAASSYAAGALVDGAIATLGTEGDNAVTNPTSSGTLMAFMKGLLTNLALGQKTKVNSLPVAVASDQTPLTTSTGTKTNVASNASSVTILAANSSRKGALIYNDSTAVLYLDLSGGTASATSYSVQIGAQGFYELPPQPIYIGLITGIWASANGNARVTEFS